MYKICTFLTDSRRFAGRDSRVRNVFLRLLSPISLSPSKAKYLLPDPDGTPLLPRFPPMTLTNFPVTDLRYSTFVNDTSSNTTKTPPTSSNNVRGALYSSRHIPDHSAFFSALSKLFTTPSAT